MPILLLTNSRDLTTDYLVKELSARQISFNRINTDTLAEQYFVLDPVHQEIEFKGPSLHFHIEDVSAAYFRRPSIPFPEPVIGAYRNYVWREWNAFLKALCAMVGDRWFNHPNAILLAEDKVRQLGLANQVGFSVPETVVTNDLNSVRELQVNFALVAKPLKQALLEEGDNSSVLFTSRIDELSDDDLASIALCPAIFQQLIPKEVDLRVTVVGSSVFTVAIHSQETEETKVDWRRGSNPSLRHEIVTLPDEIAELCIEIVRLQGLRFGAIDLVRDKDGKIWFLECNPNGQWAWIENRTGLPISACIANEMLKVGK